MLTLALRMSAHRIAALIAVAAAVLGGAALVTATGVLAETGLRSQLPPGRLAGAGVVVAADQEFHPPEDLAIALPERAHLPRAVPGRLAGLPGVTDVVADVTFPPVLLGGRSVPAHGWSSTELVPARAVEGRPPTAADEIAVGAGTGLHPGDRVGRYRVTALVDTPGAWFSDASAAGREVDLVGLVTGPGQEEQVAAAARTRLAGTGLQVLTGADRGRAVEPGAAAARSLLVLLSGSLAGIVLLVTGFVTASALGVAIAGQRRDLALMRAVGATPGQVRRLVAAQSAVVAGVALVPGTALGYLLAARFREALVDRDVLPAALPLTLGPLPALATVALLLAVVVVSALGAAWRTSRRAAIEAVAESRSEPRRPSRLRARIGLLLVAAAFTTAVAPLFQRTALGASATQIAGIVAAIGLALAGPALVPRVFRAPRDTLAAPAWLARANTRAYAQRAAGVIGPLAMGVVFVLTYALTQTTVQAATQRQTEAGTLAQYRLTGTTADVVRRVAGVRAAVPVGTTTVIRQFRQLGDVTTEASSATVVGPDAGAVLDLGVERGSLTRLTGPTVAVSRGVGEPGQVLPLVLGDGAPVTATVVAVYDRALGFGPVVLSRDLAAGHRENADAVLVRTDDEQALGRFARQTPGVALTPAGGDDAPAPPEAWINLALVVVLLGYLLLSIANRLVAATAQRRTEIAALRLAGTTPTQVVAMIRREAAIVAGAALAAGFALSAVPLGLLGVAFLGRPWPAGPVWLAPAAAIVVVATAWATTELPARRALRTPPAEALRAGT